MYSVHVFGSGNSKMGADPLLLPYQSRGSCGGRTCREGGTSRAGGPARWEGPAGWDGRTWWGGTGGPGRAEGTGWAGQGDPAVRVGRQQDLWQEMKAGVGCRLWREDQVAGRQDPAGRGDPVGWETGAVAPGRMVTE